MFDFDTARSSSSFTPVSVARRRFAYPSSFLLAMFIARTAVHSLLSGEASKVYHPSRVCYSSSSDCSRSKLELELLATVSVGWVPGHLATVWRIWRIPRGRSGLSHGAPSSMSFNQSLTISFGENLGPQSREIHFRFQRPPLPSPSTS